MDVADLAAVLFAAAFAAVWSGRFDTGRRRAAEGGGGRSVKLSAADKTNADKTNPGRIAAAVNFNKLSSYLQFHRSVIRGILFP